MPYNQMKSGERLGLHSEVFKERKKIGQHSLGCRRGMGEAKQPWRREREASIIRMRLSRLVDYQK